MLTISAWGQILHGIYRRRLSGGKRVSYRGGSPQTVDHVARLAEKSDLVLKAIPKISQPTDQTLEQIRQLAAFTLLGFSQVEAERTLGWRPNKANSLIERYPEHVREAELEHFRVAGRKMRQEIMSIQVMLALKARVAMEVLAAALEGREYNGMKVTANQRQVALKVLDAAQSMMKSTGGADLTDDIETDPAEQMLEDVADEVGLDDHIETLDSMVGDDD